MKRFYREVTLGEVAGGWQVLLDGRAVRTAGGAPQIVPSAALGEMLAAEWRAQGDEIDPRTLIARDMTDYALDVVRRERADTVARLLTYGETDTLCYRADPDEPLYQRQRLLWEPIVCACEARLGVTIKRVSGVLHHAQKPETLAAFRSMLKAQDDFALAGLLNLASLAASLITALAALEPGADPDALFAAANAEEDWQAEQWGWEWTAEENRANRAVAFRLSAAFTQAALAA
jgi:chaperone required for assembly of F1-ATPase